MAARKRIDYTVFAKNVALAFAAGFATSLAGFLAFTDSTDLPALKAAGLAALYAGLRAAVGLAKARFTDAALSVDK